MADAPAIGDLRLLGDGRGALLLTPTAEAVWWCSSRFDAPPTWWSLLDPDGPAATFDGAVALDAAESPAGATTWTVLQTDCGQIEVYDGLVGGRFLRAVRCVDGDLDVWHRVCFGGFGRAEPRTHGDVRLQAPRYALVALSIGRGVVQQVDPTDVVGRLVDAQARFEVDAGVAPACPHPLRVRDAFAVMTALTYEPTGAVIAAATTSLPEAPGADRQFDYRYAWLRDGSLAASVAAIHNRKDLATGHLRFVERLGAKVFSAPLFTADGTAVANERVVEGVRGWRDSRPVRVGNEAKTQTQFDALGFVVEAVSTATRAGAGMSRPLWSLVRSVADRCCDPEPVESNGIWEVREPAAFVSGDIGRWIALDRALRIARRRRPWVRRRHWVRARAEARARVLDALGDDGRLPQAYGGDPDCLDASALLVVMFGMLRGGDPRAVALVDAHLDALSEGPFLRRYSTSDDGFDGHEASFTPCSWWAVTALSATGRHAEARERADALCRALPRLMSEEFDATTHESLGNTPLVWSHAEAARALRALEVARNKRVRLPRLSKDTR